MQIYSYFSAVKILTDFIQIFLIIISDFFFIYLFFLFYFIFFYLFLFIYLFIYLFIGQNIDGGYILMVFFFFVVCVCVVFLSLRCR